jgi:phosphatidylglycerophosphate synthase
MSNLEEKYGDDNMFESWADLNIFFPVCKLLIEPSYQIGLTPNIITIISTIFTTMSIYLLYIEKRILASLSYLFGYTLDCVDGRMARKYNMTSEMGMVLDCVSDNISNALLVAYLLATRKFNAKNITLYIILFGLSYMLAISYGLNEAIASYKNNNSDNFYEIRVKQLEGKADTPIKKVLYSLFLFINKLSYESYRKFFPEYNEEKIYEKLKAIKEFGPGNFNLFMALFLQII